MRRHLSRAKCRRARRSRRPAALRANGVRGGPAGKRELSAEQQRALGHRDVSGFLDWGSPSGPRPVVRNGSPAELESKLPFAGDAIVTQGYVLCLLKHGYRWPTTDEPDTDG